MATAFSALVYGFFSLDHFAVGPFPSFPPVGVGRLGGLLCGHPADGRGRGLFAECCGCTVPPAGAGQWDVGFAVALAAFGRLSGHGVPGEKMGLAFLAIPFAVLARQADQWVRRTCGFLSLRALAGVERGLVGPLRYGMGLRPWCGCLKVWSFFSGGFLGRGPLRRVLPLVTGPWQGGLERAWSLWPALGRRRCCTIFQIGLGNEARGGGRGRACEVASTGFGSHLFSIFFNSRVVDVQRVQNLGYLYSLWPVFRRLLSETGRPGPRAAAPTRVISAPIPTRSGILDGRCGGVGRTDLAEGRGPIRETILGRAVGHVGPLGGAGGNFFLGNVASFLLACWR
jgi:hypothetical protein